MGNGLGIINVDEIYSFTEKKKVARLTLALPGAGCSWWKETGGCVMCGFSQSTQKYTFGGKLYPHWVFEWIIRIAGFNKIVDRHKPRNISVYNGGSFFNKEEIRRKTESYILQLVSQSSSVKEFLVESRCEYIKEKRVKSAQDILGDKILNIAIGLESSNPWIRNQIIGKGLRQDVFENTVAMLKKNNVRVLAYIFLKPFGLLNESIAIEDSISTIKYCFDLGVDEINLSCAFVQKGTFFHKRYEEGKFTPPWLWSVIKVLEETHNLGAINIGGFNDEPPPLAIPSNCPTCNPVIYKLIQDYRENGDFKTLQSQLPDCDCKKEWEDKR